MPDETYVVENTMQLGVQGAKLVTAPGLAPRGCDVQKDGGDDLTAEETTVLGSHVGRTQYLNYRRSDAQWAARSLL